MMTSKEILQASLRHQTINKIAVDFGSTAVTGMHCLIVEKLREYYGLPHNPIKIIDTLQMLGKIDDDLLALLGSDVVGVDGERDFFGVKKDGWKSCTLPWGQEVLLPAGCNIVEKDKALYTFPEGDITVDPSGIMPDGCYFWNAIERQREIDDDSLNVQDNLEEYKYLSVEDVNYWANNIKKIANKGKAIVVNFGWTGLGDAAFIPGANLKNPKGIRSIEEWYMSTVMRTDYVAKLFDKQTDIALANLSSIYDAVGNVIDVVNICGTDFGTQKNLFCSVDLFNSLYKPYYRKINDWIHSNTTWKTFKHSCGAIEPLIGSFIDAGFDILNPVQINACGMDSRLLKKKYGSKITFWGGGVDTQKELAFGTPEDVRKQVYEQCEILGKNGGFVFNTVHNIQANVPIENIVSMIETLKRINK